MHKSTTRLYQDVKKLTTIEPACNYQHLDSLNRSADYIKNE